MGNTAALVVDDDNSSRIILASMLENAGFDTLTASSGSEALKLVTESEVTLVLSDWQMPGMSGTELCEKIRESISTRYIYFIIITGELEKASAVTAISIGADDFLTKPVCNEELGARLNSATRILDLQMKLSARNDFLEVSYQSVTTDLKIAAKVQEDLLPRRFRLSGMDTNWFFKPANFVAGDMFDYFPLGEDHFAFYIIDVEGHGIASALTSFAINNQLNPSSHGICLQALRRNSDMKDVVVDTLTNLNKQFENNLDSSRYFTMIYGVMEIDTGQVTIAQAGHPAPILLRKDCNIAEALGDGGMPVGLISDAIYGTIECRLQPGDRLFIYSDGMIECQNNAGVFYGSERLLREIERSKNISIENLDTVFSDNIDEWNETERYDDDVSMVIFEYTGKR